MLKKERLEGNTVDLDEKAHSHLDLQCLKIKLFLCLALYGLKYAHYIECKQWTV